MDYQIWDFLLNFYKKLCPKILYQFLDNFFYTCFMIIWMGRISLFGFKIYPQALFLGGLKITHCFPYSEFLSKMTSCQHWPPPPNGDKCHTFFGFLPLANTEKNHWVGESLVFDVRISNYKLKSWLEDIESLLELARMGRVV